MSDSGGGTLHTAISRKTNLQDSSCAMIWAELLYTTPSGRWWWWWWWCTKSLFQLEIVSLWTPSTVCELADVARYVKSVASAACDKDRGGT